MTTFLNYPLWSYSIELINSPNTSPIARGTLQDSSVVKFIQILKEHIFSKATLDGCFCSSIIISLVSFHLFSIQKVPQRRLPWNNYSSNLKTESLEIKMKEFNFLNDTLHVLLWWLCSISRYNSRNTTRIWLNGLWFVIHNLDLNFHNWILCYYESFQGKKKRWKSEIFKKEGEGGLTGPQFLKEVWWERGENQVGWKSRFLSQSLRRLFYNALIQTHYDYAYSAWYPNLNNRLKSKLQILQNKCISLLSEFR